MKALLVLSCSFFLALNLRAESPDEIKADALFQQLVSATMSDDYNSFVAHGKTQLKAALSPTQVDAVSKQMSGRLKTGYEIDALGDLNQKGYVVYLYRLRFKDGGDDIMGMMTLKDDEVAGIFFK
jgi:hypothetical protein